MKRIGFFSIAVGMLWGLMPAVSWASGGHAKGSGALAHSLGSSSQTLIFLAMVGNVIVMSMVAAEVIRAGREQGKGGTTTN